MTTTRKRKETESPEFILLVTYGRSGSTLVMGVLNSIPGYKIVGENKMAYLSLMEFYNKMKDASDSSKTFAENFNSGQDTTNPWWNDFSISFLMKHIYNLMVNLIDPEGKARVVGFKEIRYSAVPDLSQYLDWFYYITGCKFIFLTRNINDVCKSKWHANNPKCKENLVEFEGRVWKHMEDNFHQSWFHLHFDDLHNTNPDKFKALFEWLGEEYKESELSKVLSRRYSY